jgi:hypothetical protein
MPSPTVAEHDGRVLASFCKPMMHIAWFVPASDELPALAPESHTTICPYPPYCCASQSQSAACSAGDRSTTNFDVSRLALSVGPVVDVVVGDEHARKAQVAHMNAARSIFRTPPDKTEQWKVLLVARNQGGRAESGNGTPPCEHEAGRPSRDGGWPSSSSPSFDEPKNLEKTARCGGCSA